MIQVIHGDCRQALPSLGKFHFVFADPPFNIGHGYKGYSDNKEREEFEAFIQDAVDECWECLTENGVLALHGPDDLVEMYLQAGRRNEMARIAWINWHYRFGQCGRSNWIDARCHCLIFAKTENHIWNPEDVLVDSDRVAYGDKRIHETERGGKRLPGTVWGVPSDGPYWGRVQGNSQERRPNHPNQLPEVYMERLIRAYTNPGSRVLDPFGGSGTTAVVAQALGCECVTVDISEENCRSIEDRLMVGAIRLPDWTSKDQ